MDQAVDPQPVVDEPVAQQRGVFGALRHRRAVGAEHRRQVALAVFPGERLVV